MGAMATMGAMNDENLYTVSEVASELRVSESTVRRLIQGGLLRARKVSPRLYRVTEADLRAYVASLDPVRSGRIIEGL